MEDVAGNETLQQVVRLRVTQLFRDAPEFIRALDLADADRACHGARLQHPRSRHAFQKCGQAVRGSARG